MVSDFVGTKFAFLTVSQPEVKSLFSGINAVNIC